MASFIQACLRIQMGDVSQQQVYSTGIPTIGFMDVYRSWLYDLEPDADVEDEDAGSIPSLIHIPKQVRNRHLLSISTLTHSL